ncbi:hypothetical protein P280DRAFT_74644 [Massarina eburnea CBS 473.64]|uniref:Uncharacterized protein n=1 Tax=Massarina eburnea CBS 473.64 TaxID=1395130 RepID=A0A6A6RVZ5_9PLEO|nr:hypothetical protein P280DRAFT_74644 [Massarina eburnea CBS 473.64]
MVLIPGPGIILLADITQKNVFFPVLSMPVTGGLAIYDPTIAEVYHTKWGPEIGKLVKSTLRDRSISWPIDPMGQACKSSKGCESYILAGPYQTITPWPFTNETEGVDAFRLVNAPFYAVELWNPGPEDEVLFDAKTDCELYGGFDAKNEYSTMVCIAQTRVDDVLAAG